MAATTSPTTAMSIRDSGRLPSSTRSCQMRTRPGIKIIVDIVPNHTSDRAPLVPRGPSRRHPAPRPATGTSSVTATAWTVAEPPSDWRSHFGGQAWDQVVRRAVVLPPVHAGATRPQLGQRRGAAVLPEYAAILGWIAGSTASESTWRTRSRRISRTRCAVRPHLDLRLPDDGSDPLYDRDEVHTSSTRPGATVFDEYDPPRMAVAETWHPTNRRTLPLRAPDRTGASVRLLADEVRVGPRPVPGRHPAIARSTTVMREAVAHLGALEPRHRASHVATRPTDRRHPESWLLGNGTTPAHRPDSGQAARSGGDPVDVGACRAPPYLYQGEELGLLEVADLPISPLRDPTWERTEGVLTRTATGAGFRLPWTRPVPRSDSE